IDWLTYMPILGRVVMLLMLLAVSLQRAWSCGWKHVRPFDAVRTALKLEARHGELRSLLVSAIQLRNGSNSGGGSSALRDHTCKLAEEAASSINTNEAMPFQPLQKPGMIALMSVGVIVVFAVVNGPFLGAGMARIFAPWVDVEYPTNTQIILLEHELVVKEGDSAVIEVLIEGVIPDKATISVKTAEGRARDIELDVIKDRCAYTITSASRNFTYRIKAGDDRTPWQKVRVVPAPRLDMVAVELDYPDYLQRDNETIEALTLTVPEGTGLTWQLKVDQAVSSAQIVRAEEEPIDLKLSSNGREVTFASEVAASQGYEFTWVERENGFAFTSPRYYLQVASDQPPRIELTSPTSNIVAMTGRPLDLAIRMQDDHGIGSVSVFYRVNQFEEQSVDLGDVITDGQGEQTVDWDYRDAIPNIKVGDTVAFAIQVADRYPGEEGPHVVRSETRRITFLSKQDYLEQIEKQKDRLLSRVQAIYRQQRSAHNAVLELPIEDEGYIQACQLEAIRQEMIRDQLKEIAIQMQVLRDDLAANDISEAAEAQSLEMIRAALIDIADAPIALAAKRLREQSALPGRNNAQEGRANAAHAVNTAARELAGLVLLRGIDSAQEVYARETRMMARAQALVRWHTASNPTGAQVRRLVQQQDELAEWTDALIDQLQVGMRYEKRPLAVLRLIQSVKDLKKAGTSSTMRGVALLIGEGKTEQAIAQQADLFRALLNAEFSVRLSGAYTTLLRTHDQMRLMTQSQIELRERSEGLSAEEFVAKQDALAKQQTALRKALLTLMLPSIPEQRARLFDPGIPQAPPVVALLKEADQAMAGALAQLVNGDQTAAVEQQALAETRLAELTGIVDRWSVEMGLMTQGLGTLVAASSERMSRIEDFEARVISLLEQTDIAAAENEKVDSLAEAQFSLSDELAGYIAELLREDETERDRDLAPLLGRLSQAERAMNAGVEALKADQAEEAIGYQEKAADLLAEANVVATAQNERLNVLQNLLLFQRAVGFANGYMSDIVAEQRDLLTATEDTTEDDVPGLLPVLNNLRRCMEDVAPMLDLVAARADVGTPLVFAQTDFEDAVISLEAGDKLDALDAQDVAAESLAEVQLLVQDIRAQTSYIAEIVAYLHRVTSETALAQYEQAELFERVAEADANQLKLLAEQQESLTERAEQLDRAIALAAGSPTIMVEPDPLISLDTEPKPVAMFNRTAELMQDAAKDLAAAEPASADAMELAALTLAENAASLFIVIEMLEGLPPIEITSQTEPALVQLVDVLALA
ncbi:MAG: hypothetical protein AAF711_17210, partial [Planctomycetota bacterium]